MTNGILEAAVEVDAVLRALSMDYCLRMIKRSPVWQWGEGCALRTCSAEDLVVLKAFAGREQDWVDIRSVIERQSSRLEASLVLEEVQSLLEPKGCPEDYQHLADLLEQGQSFDCQPTAPGGSGTT